MRAALLALTFVMAVPVFSPSESQKSSPPSAAAATGALAVEAQSPPQPAPAAHDDGTSVATAIAQILATDGSNFELIRGPLIEEMQGSKRWHVAVPVPGFDCSLLTFGPERQNQDFVGCAADVSAAKGESTYSTIAKTLAEQLRTMEYSCRTPAEAGKPAADLEEITKHKTIHQLFCSRGVYEPFVVLSFQRYVSPKDGFLVRLNVNSSPISRDAMPAPSTPANLPQPTVAPQPSPAVAQPAPSLNGDWSCDPSSYRCKKASVTVLGDQFTASVDTGEYPDAQHRCNSPDKHCIWSLSGTVKGLGIHGVATQFSVHGEPSNCDSPTTSHSFDAKLSDDGQRITIRTEVTYYSGIPENASPKEKPVCHDVRLNRVESVLMILSRSGQKEGTTERP